MRPLFCRQPKAMRSRMSHTSNGEAMTSVKEPKNQRMPSLESSDRTPSILVAERSHEKMKRRTSEIRRAKKTLLFIGMQVVDVENAEFDGTDNKPCSIDTARAIGEKLLDKLVLTFLKALHAEGHPPQVSDLLLGVT